MAIRTIGRNNGLLMHTSIGIDYASIKLADGSPRFVQQSDDLWFDRDGVGGESDQALCVTLQQRLQQRQKDRLLASQQYAEARDRVAAQMRVADDLSWRDYENIASRVHELVPLKCQLTELTSSEASWKVNLIWHLRNDHPHSRLIQYAADQLVALTKERDEALAKLRGTEEAMDCIRRADDRTLAAKDARIAELDTLLAQRPAPVPDTPKPNPFRAFPSDPRRLGSS